jgi:4'-phosphopantetheinyl transferase
MPENLRSATARRPAAVAPLRPAPHVSRAFEFQLRKELPRAAPIHGVIEHWTVPLEGGAEVETAAHRLLSAEERERAARFYFARDRRRYVIAHAAMRVLLAAYTGSDASALRFATTGRSKPVLAAPALPLPLHFNLSHSGELALLAVTTDTELGVDVEVLRPIGERDALARRFFAPDEARALSRIVPAQRDLAFFLCWTRKEAYVKAIGEGLHLPLDRFAVTLDPDQSAYFLVIGDDANEAAAWSLHHLAPAAGYVGATAIRGHPRRIAGWVLDPGVLVGNLG